MMSDSSPDIDTSDCLGAKGCRRLRLLGGRWRRPVARQPFVRSQRRVGEGRGQRDAMRVGADPPLCRPRRRAAPLRRGWRGTARVALARLPAVLVSVEAPDPGAARGRLLLRSVLGSDPVQPEAFAAEDIERYVEAMAQPGA